MTRTTKDKIRDFRSEYERRLRGVEHRWHNLCEEITGLRARIEKIEEFIAAAVEAGGSE